MYRGKQLYYSHHVLSNPPPPNLKYLSVLHPCSQLTQIVCYTANIQRLINICEEVCCSGLQLVLYHYAHSPFAVQLVQYIWPCVLYKIINLNTGLHLHQEVNTVWIMKKKRKVFITTEWLPWLQTNWGDRGYEKFILVLEVNCMNYMSGNHTLQLNIIIRNGSSLSVWNTFRFNLWATSNPWFPHHGFNTNLVIQSFAGCLSCDYVQ